MSVSDERLELLIDRFLDGEISPAERRLLDEELNRNGRARALLEQWQALDETSRAVVGSRIACQAGEAERVFAHTWQRHKEHSWRRVVRIRPHGHLRFAAGLAAGFLLGVVLHFALVSTGGTLGGLAGRVPEASRFAAATGAGADVSAAMGVDHVRRVTRNVDWYGFTDDAGNQWLVEGVREGTVRPAAYHGELR